MTKDDVISVVCNVCGIIPADIKRRTKQGDIVMARHFIAHYLYSSLNVPIRDIAHSIGTSVPYVYKPLFRKPVKDRVRSDALFKERYNTIESRLKDFN